MSPPPPKLPVSRTFAVRIVLSLLLSSVLLQGCGRRGSNETVSVAPFAAEGEPAAQVVATLGERSITAAEADALIAGQLHELDYQRYLLRRQATEAILLRELAKPDSRVRTARIRLVPPLPPAVQLTGVHAGIRPQIAAPVTLSVFCNFESPHCAAVQATLADLLSLFPGTLRIAARDLPLPMHPRAPMAAEAARCAGRQGKFWAFHDLLWARGRGPDREELDHVAQAVGVDASTFRQCVDERAEANAVAADAALAQSLGLGAVPAIFVNGRPALAPTTPDQLVWLIEDELKRAGVSPATGAATQPTRLPLVLRGTIVGEAPGLGLAVIGGVRPDSPVNVRREGERVTPEAILRRVDSNGVELLVAGRIETLSFASAGGGAERAADSGVERSGDEPPAPLLPPRISPMQVYLDRESVRERMADRVALSAQLKPVAMTVDGYRLLQLGDVPPGSLYELLGLQPGDVIVAVNEQPIHEGDNPLWDALDREQEVRVRVMRRGGMAHHYTYRFQ
jgi:protein-disulfide isomerase/type II secretory pathway component PulC